MADRVQDKGIRHGQEKTFREQQAERAEIDQYFLSVSHELKAPLTEIEAYARIIREDSEHCLSMQSLHDLETIEKICEDALGMVQKFMDYTKARSASLNLEIIDMRELAESIFRKLAEPFGARDIEIQISEDLPKLIADRFLISQMLRNIFSNSIKFTAGREKALIKLSVLRKGESTEFLFEDNGEGISEEFASRAFDLFEKSNSPHNPSGSGIGLNLVKEIAGRFHGNVDISSVEGENFTLSVELPNDMVLLPREGRPFRQKKEDEIRIGIIGAISGDYSDIAPCRKQAYELAAEEINAAGGILGKQVRLIYENFSSDVEKVSALAWKLAAIDQSDVLMGGQLSSARDYIREIVHKTRIPYFFNALYEGGLADHYTFCLSSTPEQNVYPMVAQMLPLYGGRCYIIAADYNYGLLSAECTKNFIEKKGGLITGVEYFTPEKEDFTDSIEKIKKADPDILISFCVGNKQIHFHAQWYQNGIPEIPVISTIGIGLSALHRRLPAPYMRNSFFMSSYLEELDTDAAAAFTRKIRARHPASEVPYIEFDAETAYTAMYIYKKAVEAAGCTETEKVIAALESGGIYFDGPGGRVSVRGEDHHVVRDEILFRVNKQNQVEKSMYFPHVSTHFVESSLEREWGRKIGLRDLGKQAPNIQYNTVYHRLL